MDPTSHCIIRPSTVAPHLIVMMAASATTPHILVTVPLNSTIAAQHILIENNYVRDFEPEGTVGVEGDRCRQLSILGK